MRARSRTQLPWVGHLGVKEALAKTGQRLLHLKNQFRILKPLLIDNAALPAMSWTDPGPSVRSPTLKAKRIWLAAFKGEVQ
jgi:hypothetical protein